MASGLVLYRCWHGFWYLFAYPQRHIRRTTSHRYTCVDIDVARFDLDIARFDLTDKAPCSPSQVKPSLLVARPGRCLASTRPGRRVLRPELSRIAWPAAARARVVREHDFGAEERPAVHRTWRRHASRDSANVCRWFGVFCSAASLAPDLGLEPGEVLWKSG